MGHQPDAQRGLDGGHGALLAPCGLQVTQVPPPYLGEIQPLACERDGLDISHEATKLCLRLRTGESLAGAVGALGTDAALQAAVAGHHWPYQCSRAPASVRTYRRPLP